MSCCEASSAALEPMVGTAARIDELLLLEVRGAWARDVIAENELPDGARERLREWTEAGAHRRVLFVRKPERRSGPLALYTVECGEHGGVAMARTIASHGELASLDLDAGGRRVAEPLWLVCAHGRRDLCCSRLGVPLYDALVRTVAPERVWQTSHQGGHRFAGNALVAPYGVQLGRVRPVDVERVAAGMSAGMLPLPFLRGRTVYDPPVQAADVHVRERLGEAQLTAVRYAGPGGDGEHLFVTRLGDVRVRVRASQGPAVPPSCGAEPEPATVFAAEIADGAGW
ncbi:MAG: hypothetical protein FJW96_11625 [Actinobacteria bacterium]|nr:hypothetical protein [Actinomycetota bacterium]